MKLRDLWPAIVTFPLLCLPVLSWQSETRDLESMDSVMGRVSKVTEYTCTSRGRRSVRRCYELTIEYRTPDGRKRRRVDYQKARSRPAVGEEIPVLVNSRRDGPLRDGARPGEAYHVTQFLALFSVAMFALGLHASVKRVRRRRSASAG